MGVDATRLGMFAEWFERHRPKPAPGNTPAGNVVMSHSVVAYGEIVILRLALHGFHMAEFHINPLVALKLAGDLLEAGQSAGWLDAKGGFITSDPGDE